MVRKIIQVHIIGEGVDLLICLLRVGFGGVGGTTIRIRRVVSVVSG